MDPNCFRDITIKFDNEQVTLPLYLILASIAEQFYSQEIISYNTPFGTITFKA